MKFVFGLALAVLATLAHAETTRVQPVYIYLHAVGNVFEIVRAADGSADRALVSAAIDGMLRAFPSDEIRISSDRQMAETAAPAAAPQNRMYKYLNVLGDVLERLRQQDDPERDRSIAQAAINGILKSVAPSSAKLTAIREAGQKDAAFDVVIDNGAPTVILKSPDASATPPR